MNINVQFIISHSAYTHHLLPLLLLTLLFWLLFNWPLLFLEITLV